MSSALRISGHLIATSYLAVQQGTDANVARVMKAPLVEGVFAGHGQGPDRAPTISYVPLIPSNSLRGRIRSETINIVAEALMKAGKVISTEAYVMLRAGGMIGSGDARALTVGEIVRARRNIVVGLWGGGPRVLTSAVTTCDLMPVCAETIATGWVPDELLGFAPMRTRRDGDTVTSEAARGRDLIAVRRFFRRDPLLSPSADAVDRMPALGEDWQLKLAGYQAEQFGLREARSTAKVATGGKDARAMTDEQRDAVKKRDLANLLEAEVVLPGTVWPVDLRLAGYVTPAQVGLFCRGLERLFAHGSLGSFASKGFGRFAAFLRIEMLGERIGTLTWSQSRRINELVFSDTGYDEAMSEELASLDPVELNGFASAGTEEADGLNG